MNLRDSQKFSVALLQGIIFGLLVFVYAASSWALPFNDDMVHDQFDINEVMRKLPADSVPLSAAKLVRNLQEAKNLENPVQGNPASARNGELLWQVNCVPCHGEYANGKYQAGVVGAFLPLPGPDLSDAAYHDRTDGHFWGIVHFGSAIMPRYGWKLSDREHWDLVNYIRKIQGKD